MSGLFGALAAGSSDSEREEYVAAAKAALRHRGSSSEVRIADGVCLLGAIRSGTNNLIAAHAAPVRSATGDTLVLDGSVYNSAELRASIPAPDGGWRTGSDAEVLLELLARQQSASLSDVVGAFAFAWWRPTERELLLVRDRLGKKPLYWTQTASGSLRFASEVGALLADGTVTPRTSPDRIAEYLQYGYNLASRTSFVGIHQLPAGHLLRARLTDAKELELRVDPYWSLPAYEPLPASSRETWREEVAATIADAVRLRLRANVPVGALLSGGVDSSVVSLLARRSAKGSLTTLALDFGANAHSEAAYAQEVANHLGTTHMRVSAPPPSPEHILQIVELFGELHGDVGSLATLAACKGIRDHARVVLAGTGGDELMAGYTRYHQVLSTRRQLTRLPGSVKRIGGTVARHWPGWVRGDGTLSLFAESLHDAYASTMKQYPARTNPPLFPRAVPHWLDGTVASLTRHADRPPLLRMMAADAETYIPGDLAVSLDRTSVSAGIELRCPLLDHRLFELVARARPEWLVDGDRGKLPLRESFAAALPSNVFTRAKRGFAPPIAQWVRDKRFEPASSQILDGTSPIYQVLDRARVRALFSGFALYTHNCAGRLWSLFILDAWLRRWRPSIVEPPQHSLSTNATACESST